MTGRLLLRVAARIGLASVLCICLAVTGVQFARIVGENLSYANQLAQTRGDVAALEATKARRLAEIRRLSDPRGALPEIHDRLHLVGDHQEIIYLAQPPAAPGDP